MADWCEATTLADLLVRAVSRDPDHEAVVFPDSRRSYAQLLDDARRTARGLAGLGVAQGDHVGVFMPNCMDFLRTLFGVSMLGAVVVPINARYRATELAFIGENADLVTIVTSDMVADHVDLAQRLVEAFPTIATGQPDTRSLRIANAPRLRSVVLLGGSTAAGFVSQDEFESIADEVTESHVEDARARTRIRDTAIMLYTSGTTANPKGCPHSHEALVRNAFATGRTRFELTPDDRFWDPLPLFHVGALLPLLATFDAGATFLSMTYFEPGEALRMMSSERVTVAFPAFLGLVKPLMDHPDLAATDLGTLRTILSVGPPEFLRAVQTAFPGAVQISTYGSTETAGVITYHHLSDAPEVRATTCGLPFRGVEIRIADLDTGEILPAGQRGEILVGGYSRLEGYYKDEEATKAAIDPDGWFHSGDLGMLDEHGQVIYLGRVKDMLKVGGENVAAVEIEGFLTSHPAVSAVAVVGVPDGRLDEVPAAFVEVVPGASLTEEEVVEFCRGQIASFKVPRYVRFVTEWPMSATKIQKFRLRDDLLRELGLTT